MSAVRSSTGMAGTASASSGRCARAHVQLVAQADELGAVATDPVGQDVFAGGAAAHGDGDGPVGDGVGHGADAGQGDRGEDLDASRPLAAVVARAWAGRAGGRR